MALPGSDALAGPLAALVDRGEQNGCVNLSELDELVQALELDDADLTPLYEALDKRGVELRDDCSRENPSRRSTTCSSRARRPTRCSCS